MSSDSDTKVKRKVSKRQVEANRRNGMKGGPKSTAGKKRVKYNAMKHGLLAKAVVTQSGEGQENLQEFSDLLESLQEDYQPQGAMEEFLVERFATLMWRMRRSLRAEIGEIKLNTDSVTSETFARKAKDFKSKRELADLGLDISSIDVLENSYGTNYVLLKLQEARSTVEDTGLLPDKDLIELRKYLGEEQGSFTFLCKMSTVIYEQKITSSESGEALSTESSLSRAHKELLSRFIGLEIERIEQIHERNRERDTLQNEAETLKGSIPSQESVYRLVRYETAIERQMWRTVQLLEYYQAKSKGAKAVLTQGLCSFQMNGNVARSSSDQARYGSK